MSIPHSAATTLAHCCSNILLPKCVFKEGPYAYFPVLLRGGFVNGKCAFQWSLWSKSRRIFHATSVYIRKASRSCVVAVATNCRNLTFVMCANLAAKPNLNASLGYNVNIQELRLENVWDLQVSHFDDVCLPHLRLISLYCSSCNDVVLRAVVRTTEKLQHLNIGGCVHITEEGIIAATKHCPLLRSLGLAQLQVGDDALLKLTTSCSHINNMQLQDNKLVTDTGVLFISQN